MIFWVIIVFILGLVGLVHEIFLIEYNVPFLAEATSVAIMLISLGMAYRLVRYHRAGRLTGSGEPHQKS